MSDTFKDWIPEGEDTGAITANGFQDFVPAPEPKPQAVQEEQQPVHQVNPDPIVPPLDGGNQ